MNPTSASRAPRAFGLLAAALLLSASALVSGCDDDPAGACSIDLNCGARGSICTSGECESRTCSSDAECTADGDNRVCYAGSCTAIECTRDDACSANEVCSSGVCVDPANASCSNDNDCASLGRVCNVITGLCVEDTNPGCTSNAECTVPGEICGGGGVCVPGCTTDDSCSADSYCAGDGTCMVGCRENGCTGGESCNLETRVCGAACTIASCAAMGMACDTTTGACVARDGKGLCETCTLGSDECGGPGDRCVSIDDQNVCSFACESGADCPSGFNCTPITTASSACVPSNLSCTGCLIEGCTNAGEVCNPVSGNCQAAISTCSPCSDDFECAEGSSCSTFQARTRCLENCDATGGCPTDFVCNSASNLCEPGNGFCTMCNPLPTCGSGQVVDDDRCECVECVADSDCGNGELCAKGTGECVTGIAACMSDGDCSGLQRCYGALAPDRNGVCVECNADADCGSTNMYCDNNSCVPCNCTAPEVCSGGNCLAPGSCGSNADCEATLGTGALCDGPTSKCYIPGSCSNDGIQAPCASGSCQELIPGMGLCDCTFDPLNPSGGCRTGESCLIAICTAGGGFP